MPEPRRPVLELPPSGVVSEALELVIASRRSGYIRFIDIPRLRSLAVAYRVCLRMQRRVGHFVPEGVALLHVSRGDRVTEGQVLQLLALRALPHPRAPLPERPQLRRRSQIARSGPRDAKRRS